MKKLFFILTLSLFALNNVYSQEKIWLLNGKVDEVKNIVIDSSQTISFVKKNNKPGIIKKNRVFSIYHTDGKETIIYYQDTSSFSNDLSIEEMRMFVRGEQDAIKNYKSRMATAGGFIIGAGSTILKYFGPIIPLIYVSALGSFSPKESKIKASDPEWVKDLNYVDGYQKKARSKKVTNALISSAIGFVGMYIVGVTILEK